MTNMKIYDHEYLSSGYSTVSITFINFFNKDWQLGTSIYRGTSFVFQTG